MEFDQLWRGHGTAGVVNGFDHSHFDEVQAGWESRSLGTCGRTGVGMMVWAFCCAGVDGWV